MDIIKKLNTIEKRVNSTQKLYEIYKSIKDEDHIYIPYILSLDEKIIRLRINPKNKRSMQKSDLTYPDPCFVTDFGRANIPYHPMFYGSVFTANIDSTDPPPRIITASETSYFFRQNNNVGLEMHTYSAWRVTKELKILALPFSNNYDNPCNDIINSRKILNESLGNKLDNSPAGLLAQYMSDELAKDVEDNNEYFIIANYIHYLMYINTITKKFDGILFPSVRYKGNGFNIALKPSTVTNNIKLEGAAECILVKCKDEMYLFNYRDAKLIENSDNLEYYIRGDFNSDTFNDIVKGLVFVN